MKISDLLGLKLPEKTDNFNVGDINYNFQDIENRLFTELDDDMAGINLIGFATPSAVVDYVQKASVLKVLKQGEGEIDALKNVDIISNQAFNGIQNGEMQYKSATNYNRTDFILVKQGKTATFNGTYRMFCAFTSDKRAIADSYKTSNQTDFTYTATDGDKYVQVVYYNDGSERSIIIEAEEYIKTIEDGVNLNNGQIEQVKKALVGGCEYKNMLTGKKWVACGDSLTEGSSALTDKFTSGLYAGQKKTYPFFVGNRCGMVVVNEAQSGSTLSYCPNRIENGQPRVDHFSNTRYKSAEFVDADYITIKIGTNDDSAHQNVPIGTIDDVDNTTFYGAWNTVLSYLTQTYPKKHIGIIVSNVATLPYVEATIAAATKWGVPYLNMALDPQLPLAYRSIRTDVTQSAKDARNAAFKVNVEGDSHPNAEWHEFESRLIESWLMTI